MTIGAKQQLETEWFCIWWPQTNALFPYCSQGLCFCVSGINTTSSMRQNLQPTQVVQLMWILQKLFWYNSIRGDTKGETRGQNDVQQVTGEHIFRNTLHGNGMTLCCTLVQSVLTAQNCAAQLASTEKNTLSTHDKRERVWRHCGEHYPECNIIKHDQLMVCTDCCEEPGDLLQLTGLSWLGLVTLPVSEWI